MRRHLIFLPLLFYIFASMIEYKKRILANGLTIVVNRDKASKLAAVNILYKVGARNENPRARVSPTCSNT